jgi:hypothetical protein
MGKFSVRFHRLLTLAVFFLIVTTLAFPQTKKYQVIVPRANLYLEPSEKSPVVTEVPTGEILVQASALKFKHEWVFVYYRSNESGKTVAGYVKEQMIRKLFPEVNSILLYSSDQTLTPREIDFNQKFELPLIWGMPVEKFLEVAGRPLNKETSGELEVYQYRQNLMNKPCLVEYIFWRNELVSARFHLLETYSDNNYYISDYLKLKNYLESHFGQPAYEQVDWLDPTYKDKSNFWGKALGSGQLEFRSSWIAGDTEIKIILTGSDNKVAFLAECAGLKYKGLSY